MEIVLPRRWRGQKKGGSFQLSGNWKGRVTQNPVASLGRSKVGRKIGSDSVGVINDDPIVGEDASLEEGRRFTRRLGTAHPLWGRMIPV